MSKGEAGHDLWDVSRGTAARIGAEILIKVYVLDKIKESQLMDGLGGKICDLLIRDSRCGRRMRPRPASW